MEIIPQEQVMKRFQVLPEALKNAIFSEKTSDAVSKNCALRDIPGNKIPLVGQLTSRVLLGYLRPELFAREIQNETGVSEMMAQHVAHDIDMEIFSEVRLELKKLYPPTMQTPTVQSWTAQKSNESGMGSPPTTNYPPPTKPKYVIPIPERFQTKSFSGMAPQPKQPPATIPAAPLPIAEPTQQTPKTPPVTQAVPAVEQKPGSPLIAQPQPSPASTPTPATPEKKQEPLVLDASGQPQTGKASAPSLSAKPEDKKSQPGQKIAQTIEPSGVRMNPVVPLPTFIGSRFQMPPEDAAKNDKDSEQKIKDLAAKFITSSTAQQKPQQESAYKEKLASTQKQAAVDLSKF